MHGMVPAADDVRRREQRQVLEPQTSGFRLAVPVLPWMDDLVRLSDLGADDRYRVFDSNPLDRRRHQRPDKPKGILLFSGLALAREMASARYGKMRAWRMRNHQIPMLRARHLGRIAHDVMLVAVFRWLVQIARPRVMPVRAKSGSNSAGEFTSDEHLHLPGPR